MRKTGTRRTTWAAVACAATALLTTTGFAGTGAASTPRHENVAASAAVQTLTAPAELSEDSVPADFASVMGYTPVRIDGMLANPGGDCSSPVPLPLEFDTSCKAHDLGYDLLRYASRSGEDLGPWARQSLDAQLDQRMHAACDTRADEQARAQCFVMANVATTFVTGNSWRQSYSAPVTESGLPYVLAGGVGVVLLAGAAWSIRRRPHPVGAVA
ncbi:hypothetical protein AXA44_35960 [Rhodococcus sp. SC4]|uniref:hypothetical protein n=1 Tax=Rhodococcus sp. LB1 TaxID=1807499 RepID=UPI000769C059|nr:hypothetical protein [Rhodococcus sp. LB1]KXF55876.1 hypothetical protein AXA44_35960 [Rhodococcus sp. SC4]KXX62513.1 hypothetical protein AZG88_28355 [Rhodococcus sp. LB1]